MSTYTLGTDITNSTPTDFIPVKGGIYMLAASADTGQAMTVQLKLNIGGAQGVDLFDTPFLMTNVKTIVLPDCTVSVVVTGFTDIGAEHVAVALTRIGDVSGYVQPDTTDVIEDIPFDLDREIG